MVSHTINSLIPADLDKEPSIVKYDTNRTTTVQHMYIFMHCTVWPIEKVKVQNFPKKNNLSKESDIFDHIVLPHDEFSQEQIQQYLIF